MKSQKAMLSLGLFLFRVAVVLLIVVGIYKVGELSYTYCYSIVAHAPVELEPGRDVAVTLTDDMSAKKVAELLETKGLVKDADIFRAQLKLNDYKDKLKAGNYILNTSMTPDTLMKVMAQEVTVEEEE